MKTKEMNKTKARVLSIILTLMLILQFGIANTSDTYAATTTEKVTFVIHTTDIPNTKGVYSDSTTKSTLSYGSTQNKAQKWFDNKVANGFVKPFIRKGWEF